MKHIGTEKLETQRLILRRFEKRDAESCCRNWASHDAVYTYISERPKTSKDMEMFLDGADEAYAALDTYYWAIALKASGEVIGEIFVDEYENRNSWCEIDYKIGPDFWGQGFASESVTAVLRFLFGQVGFHRIQAKCSVENTGSERVLQKAGMRKEGILRGFFRRKDGNGFDDVVLYAVLSEEWRK